VRIPLILAFSLWEKGPLHRPLRTFTTCDSIQRSAIRDEKPNASGPIIASKLIMIVTPAVAG
jgi:hypothetical protein